jgi:hypothetical protein
MSKQKLSDKEAKNILLRWPTRTKTVWPPPRGSGYWIRAQPNSGNAASPRLQSPGAKLFSTQPDGLWVYFRYSYCDVVAVEVCGSIQNLNDKRSRYFPSSHSTVLSCNPEWFSESVTVQKGVKKARWEACGSFKKLPSKRTLAIRHLRVLFALPNNLYGGWRDNHVPTGHEFFCAHSSLDSYNSQPMQLFLGQMSIASQFYSSK